MHQPSIYRLKFTVFMSYFVNFAALKNPLADHLSLCSKI